MPQPKPGSRVLVALSGGVDSSVAAALLCEAGCDVVGVTLHLWDAMGDQQVGRCCAPEDREDARRTCEVLGIPHYVLDERQAFREQVVDPFVRDNLAGETPVPCARCNQSVKLFRLIELAERFGASHVATGHYARLVDAADGSVELWRGKDSSKDQSYFLFGLTQAALAKLWFPLGELTKPETRREGQRLRVPNFDKPDSQELCFVPGGDVAGFVASQSDRAGRSGPLLDTQGRVLGAHHGIEGFTVGQRRGIRVSGPTPRYVLQVVPERNAVVVGGAGELASDELRAERACWVGPAPQAAFAASVRIRHRHPGAKAFVEPCAGGFRARFAERQRAIAPGQAAVIYQGERVVGGGFIARSDEPSGSPGAAPA